MKVLVLGASGMLGSMVLEVLQEARELTVQGTARAGAPVADPRLHPIELDAETALPEGLDALLDGFDWAINCTGVIKHNIVESRREDVERAIRVNALFPHALARAASTTGCRVLQIATDCVYSGSKGGYIESDPHDAKDAYGKTKSLGEAPSDRMHHLRCSIIGPELRGRRSLLEWFLGQPQGARVRGYSDHYWNGVTTLQFARICRGILLERPDLPTNCHVVPGDALSKGLLLQVIAKAFNRPDLHVDLCPAPEPLDRTLATIHPALNRCIWAAAGYQDPPQLETMVEELAQHARARHGARP